MARLHWRVFIIAPSMRAAAEFCRARGIDPNDLRVVYITTPQDAHDASPGEHDDIVNAGGDFRTYLELLRRQRATPG